MTHLGITVRDMCLGGLYSLTNPRVLATHKQSKELLGDKWNSSLWLFQVFIQ